MSDTILLRDDGQYFIVGDDAEIRRQVTDIPAGDELLTGWFTLKNKRSDLDAAAVIQKQINSAYTGGQGQIEDTGADGTGVIFFELTAANTAGLTPGKAYFYDIQVKTANGKLVTPESGTATFQQQITRTTG